MFDFLVYLAESALCLAALYLIYKVAMSNETLHRLNRVLLLGSVVLSAVLPLCRLKIIREYDPVPIAEPLGLEEFAVAEAVEVGIDYVSLLKDLAVVVFILGVAFMLVRLAVGIYSVWRLIHSGEMSVIEEDVTLTVVSQLSSPFSWFGHIVASQSDVQEYRRMILSHELAHIRLRHSWDVMAVDLALCLWWFNPAMWLLRRELQSLHEYQADDAVLRDGVDAKTYQMLLIKRAVGSRLHSVANCLNHSNLKNRITMMCKKTSSRWAATKALLVVPMVAVALSAFATTVYVPRELQDKVTENSVNSKEYKPAIVEIKGSEIYLNDKLVTAAELEAVIEDYRLQTLIYDENDAESKRTYEAIHNTLKLNRNIDVTYSDGKRPEVSVVRISGDKIYLNDEQITLEQLKAKADAMDKLATIVMHADVNTDAEQLNAVKDAFRHTSHAVKVISENERIAIVDGKVVPYAEMMKIESSSIGNARLTYDYNTLPQGLGISEEAVKKNGAIVITLKKDGQTAVLDNPVKDKVIVFADEQDKGGSKTQSSTITILGNNDNTKMTAIQIDNAGEGGEMKVKVNGKDVPYETLKTIPSEEIGEMKIVKLDGVGTIYVTTKDELEAQTKEFEQKMKDFEKRIPEFEQKMQEFEQAEKQFAKADKDFKQAEKQFAKAEKAFKQMEKDVQQQNPPYIKAEKMPKFRNGDLMLFQNWMQNNVQYPAEAIEKGISGRVVFSFVVEADGSLSSYQLMASPDKILADEVERVFNSSPREWTAGEQDGKKVRVKLTLPVVFAAVADASENVSGQVVDAKGEPFVGVVVQVDGFDERGVVTDAEGRFSISMSKGETLKFSYIGMDTKRVKVDNTDKPISVTMK
ncbi:MAG: energy transducer TonB [Alistipes sp.]|nr:energy transducer TonB [Alistipes sp.]